MTHKITWHGTGQRATQPSNPAYPDGIHIGLTKNQDVVCRVKLPYPAEGIGHWIITCRNCGITVACTAAGRRDDPRSITIACIRK